MAAAAATPSVRVRFAPCCENDRLELLELPPALLQELLDAGSRGAAAATLEIRGDVGDTAVVVSSDKTFAVRRVESSNTVLLALAASEARALAASKASSLKLDATPTASDSGDWLVLGTVSSHLELVEALPRLARLRELLSENPLSAAELEGEGEGEGEGSGEGEEDASGSGGEDQGPRASAGSRPATDGLGTQGSVSKRARRGPRAFSFEDLQRLVQASDAQLRQGLEDVGALLWRGFYRVLHADLAIDCGDNLLNTVTARDWPVKKIPVEACLEAMSSDFPMPIAIHTLRSLCAPFAGKEAALDDVKVARFRAMQIFHLRHHTMHKSEFLVKWDQLVPFGLARPSIEALSGLAIVTELVGGTFLRWCPHWQLASEPGRRFEQLFAAKPRWPQSELAPFVSELVPPGTSIDSFLLRFAVAVPGATASGALCYIARK